MDCPQLPVKIAEPVAFEFLEKQRPSRRDQVGRRLPCGRSDRRRAIGAPLRKVGSPPGSFGPSR